MHLIPVHGLNYIMELYQKFQIGVNDESGDDIIATKP